MKQGRGTGPDIDARTGQPVEEAEDNLSRHSTADSSPPVEEQARTSVEADPVTRSVDDEGDSLSRD